MHSNVFKYCNSIRLCYSFHWWTSKVTNDGNMNPFFACTHCIKATRKTFVILDSLIMVCGFYLTLYLVFSLTGFTQQSQSTRTMLTSLKNLVMDNSRSTVTFNSTVLRKLFALSANRPGMENDNYGSLLLTLYQYICFDIQWFGCCRCPSYWFYCFEDRRISLSSLVWNLM